MRIHLCDSRNVICDSNHMNRVVKGVNSNKGSRRKTGKLQYSVIRIKQYRDLNQSDVILIMKLVIRNMKK